MSSIQGPLEEPQAPAHSRASDASADLFGLSVSEAFRKFVLEDPEIAALGKTIVEQEGKYSEVFNDGQCPGPIVEHNWPLDISASDLAFRFVHPVIIMVPGPPLPEPSAAIHQVSKLLADKLQALRHMLVTGRLVAHGTFEKTGVFGVINRLQWARDGVLVDVKSGDLLQEIDHRPVVQWSGLSLEAPAPPHPSSQTQARSEISRVDETPSVRDRAEKFHVKTTGDDGLRSNPPSTGEVASAARTTPQRASIEAAIEAIWPEGIPASVPIKTRDEKIINWQRNKELAIASARTIRRHLAAKAASP